MFERDWRVGEQVESFGRGVDWKQVQRLVTAARGEFDAQRAYASMKEAMWEQHELVYRVFQHYAALEVTSNIFSISRTEWDCLVHELLLASPPHCRHEDLDLLFIEINQLSQATPSRPLVIRRTPALRHTPPPSPPALRTNRPAHHHPSPSATCSALTPAPGVAPRPSAPSTPGVMPML